MKRWLLTMPILLGGIFGLAQANYVIVVANVGGVKATPDPKTTTQPGGLGSGDLYQDSESEPRLIVGIVELREWPDKGELDRYTLGQTTMLHHRWGGEKNLGYIPVVSGDKILGDKSDKEEDKKQLNERLSNFPGIVFLHGQRTKLNIQTPEGLKQFDAIGAPLLKTPAQRFFEARNKHNSLPKATTKKVLELAEFALQHGLVKDFESVMDGAVTSDRDKADPAVVRYARVRERLRNALPDEPDSGWYGELRKNAAFKRVTRVRAGDKGDATIDTLYFTVYHSLESSENDAIRSRLPRLDDAFRTYYYWWALKGPEVPLLPPHRVVVVLTGPGEFFSRHEALTFKRMKSALDTPDGKDPRDESLLWRHQHSTYSNGPIVADGFVARRPALAVLCVKRTDQTFHSLDKVFDTPESTKKMMKLTLNDRPRPDADEPDKIRRYTYALLLKSMEEDGERAGVSHNISRQLLFVSGVLPTNVAVPEWIQFGLASFFETPLGAPWASPTDLSPLYWSPAFKKEFGSLGREQMVKVLQSVVTDRDFRQSVSETNKPLALYRARAFAWNLTYFLATADKDTRAGLVQYGRELAKLPRDREIDEQTLLLCFARAFGLLKTDREIDETKWNEFALRWQDVMREKNLESAELLTAVETYRDAVEKAANPPAP
jgi:hypothetical protein